MRRTQLLSIVQSLLPPDTSWHDNQGDLLLAGGKTVLMIVTRVPDPHLAVKLIDYVCPLTSHFWERDFCGRHVIMDACHYGVHPTVLLRLIKWARRLSLKTMEMEMMSGKGINGLDAVEVAIQGGHGELASCLLEQQNPISRDLLPCVHYPLKVLELAIETRNEHSVRAILTNKRVVHHLQPGKAEHLNLIARWTQRQTPMKRLYNIFTCVGAAVRCGMTDSVEIIYKLNPQETRQATWYAVYRLRLQARGRPIDVPPGVHRIANSYLLDQSWYQLGVIMLIRYWEQVAEYERTCFKWERMRHWKHYGHRDWDAIAIHPWTTLPTDVFSNIVSFLLPSESKEARKMAFLVEY